MVKGLVGGLRTLLLSFALLFAVPRLEESWDFNVLKHIAGKSPAKIGLLLQGFSCLVGEFHFFYDMNKYFKSSTC